MEHTRISLALQRASRLLDQVRRQRATLAPNRRLGRFTSPFARPHDFGVMPDSADGRFGLVRAAAWHFTFSRVIFLACFVLGSSLLPPGNPAAPVNRDQPVPLPGRGELMRLLEQSAVNYGDAGWYEALARNGYDKVPFVAGSTGFHNWCFFPAQAWMTRLVTQNRLRLALPMIMGLLATMLMSVNLQVMFDARTARIAIALMMYFPFSYVISQFRPESLMFFCFSLALWLRDRTGMYRYFAMIPLAMAGFCKPNGFLIGIFWLPELWAGMRANWRSPRNVALALAPAASMFGIAAMTAWMFLLTGAPLAWAAGQRAWGAELVGTPYRQMLGLLDQPMLIDRWGWDPTLENWIIFAAVWVSFGALLWRRQFVAAAFLLSTSLLSFMSLGVWVQGKHLATVFPLFAGLSECRLADIPFSAVVAILAMLLALSGFLSGAQFHSLMI